MTFLHLSSRLPYYNPTNRLMGHLVGRANADRRDHKRHFEFSTKLGNLTLDLVPLDLSYRDSGRDSAPQ